MDTDNLPYTSIFNRPPDFEVSYSLSSEAERERGRPAFQHIRWSFMYDEYPHPNWMIFPEIIDASSGDVYESGTPIPTHSLATMWLLDLEHRQVHQDRIRPGVRGFFMDENRKVGVCEVTRVIGL